jgi:hypothetical protein
MSVDDDHASVYNQGRESTSREKKKEPHLTIKNSCPLQKKFNVMYEINVKIGD